MDDEPRTLGILACLAAAAAGLLLMLLAFGW
jgi:hypothetical protein